MNSPIVTSRKVENMNDISAQRKEEQDTERRMEEEEHEFLLEFTEPHPPETLKSLDQKMDELIGDIGLLLESRGKDYQNTPGRKDRLPVMPEIDTFECFRTLRKEKLEESIKVNMPSRRPHSSAVMADQV